MPFPRSALVIPAFGRFGASQSGAAGDFTCDIIGAIAAEFLIEIKCLAFGALVNAARFVNALASG